MNKSFEDLEKEIHKIVKKNRVSIEIKYSTDMGAFYSFEIFCSRLLPDGTLLKMSRNSSINNLRYNIEELAGIVNNSIKKLKENEDEGDLNYD